MGEFEQHQFRTGDGASLNFLSAGSGRPLVMSPGWSQTAMMYKHQLHGLKDFCRVIALDPRGHGDSEDVTWGYTVQRLAMDLHELLVEHELDEVTLMGHSMGNSVIWAYLQLFGNERLEKLIIVDQPTMLTINPEWTEEIRLEKGGMFTSEQLWQACNDLAGPDGAKTTDEFIRNLMSPMIDEAEQKWIIRENLKMPRPAASELLYNHSSQDWTETIKRIRLPTLVFAGRASKSPWQGQQWIHQQIPDSKFCLLEEDEGGHHFMFLENPVHFNQTVRSFLA
jgi:non-heme chloroperoxidase